MSRYATRVGEDGQPMRRGKMAVERMERKEELFTFLDAYLTTNDEMPSRKWVMEELTLGSSTMRYYVDELVIEGRLVRPGRWNSMRVVGHTEHS